MFETRSTPSPLETQLAALCAELSGLHFTQAADDDVDLEVLTRHDLVGLAALAEVSGWELADVLRDLPPVADVDGWTVIEMLKGLAKLERFVQAQKVRVLADPPGPDAPLLTPAVIMQLRHSPAARTTAGVRELHDHRDDWLGRSVGRGLNGRARSLL